MNIKEDAKIVRPFLEAVKTVLSTMAMMDVAPGTPFMKRDSTAIGDVTGIIGFSGERNGSISVTFSQDCILVIVGNMLGETMDFINKDVRDAVGELTNMISGQSRRGLQEAGLTIEAGIPTVIVGENHSISHISKNPILAIPFTTPQGSITLEVSLD